MSIPFLLAAFLSIIAIATASGMRVQLTIMRSSQSETQSKNPELQNDHGNPEQSSTVTTQHHHGIQIDSNHPHGIQIDDNSKLKVSNRNSKKSPWSFNLAQAMEIMGFTSKSNRNSKKTWSMAQDGESEFMGKVNENGEGNENGETQMADRTAAVKNENEKMGQVADELATMSIAEQVADELAAISSFHRLVLAAMRLDAAQEESGLESDGDPFKKETKIKKLQADQDNAIRGLFQLPERRLKLVREWVRREDKKREEQEGKEAVYAKFLEMSERMYRDSMQDNLRV
jgi:hypothetical protein